LPLAVKVFIPYFRGGDVHYTAYFTKFGATPGEVMLHLVTRPDVLLGELCTAENALFALTLLGPLAFLPLLSPTRLAVSVPLFCALCLNEITDSRNPQHHFHAPLVAILFWAAAAGLGHV